MSSNWNNITSLFVIFFLYGLVVNGQNLRISPTSNSPFSRFGIGNFADQYTAMQAGMAGLTTANIDFSHLNFENPAALAYLQATSFQLGISTRYSAYEEPDNSENIWSGNLNYIALGFPLINPVNRILDRAETPVSLGMSFSLRPYTVVGYDILTKIEIPEIGTTSNSFKGSGSAYRLMWSNSVRYKNFSAGVNIGAIFGKTTNSRRVEFDSLSASYSTEFQEENSFGGWIWEAGFLYTLNLNEVDNTSRSRAGRQKRLVFGISGNGNNFITTNSSFFQVRDNPNLFDVDTLSFGEDILRQAVLPTELSFGITYEKVNQLKLGIQYDIGLWSNFRNESIPTNFNDNFRVAIGGEYIPNILSINRYFEKVRYRFGAFYGNDPRVIGGEQLEEYGITLGIGFPMIRPRETISYFNIAFELGQFGVTDVLKETYFKMTFGFALNDNSWFFKRKFD